MMAISLHHHIMGIWQPTQLYNHLQHPTVTWLRFILFFSIEENWLTYWLLQKYQKIRSSHMMPQLMIAMTYNCSFLLNYGNKSSTTFILKIIIAKYNFNLCSHCTRDETTIKLWGCNLNMLTEIRLSQERNTRMSS